MEKKEKVLVAFSITLLLLYIAGCGYRVIDSSVQGLKSIHIKDILNLTVEPGLEDVFRREFADVAALYGVELSRNAPVHLSITITDYRLQSVSLRDALTSEYMVIIKADVEVLGPEGKRVLKALSPEFPETFYASEDITLIQAQKELATERAIKDLCRKILLTVDIMYSNDS